MKYILAKFTVAFVPNSLRIQYRPSDDTMMVDMSVFQSLEIMQNVQNPKSKDSLLGLLNHTLTPMGGRMLRNNILQPSTRLDAFLTPRYDALEELSSNESMYMEIRKGRSSRHCRMGIFANIFSVEGDSRYRKDFDQGDTLSHLRTEWLLIFWPDHHGLSGSRYFCRREPDKPSASNQELC